MKFGGCDSKLGLSFWQSLEISQFSPGASNFPSSGSPTNPTGINNHH